MYPHLLSRAAVAFVLVLSATSVDLAFGQETHVCNCPNARVMEIKACQPTNNCQGMYSVTGCDTINPQNNCYTCRATAQICCATHYLDWQNGNQLCGASSEIISMIRGDQDGGGAEIDAHRVFVPICRGTYMSLDQVLGSSNFREVNHAYIPEH
jgi:hypothetical protein